MMSDVLIKIMNMLNMIFELSHSYRAPSAQVKIPRPFFLSSLYSPTIRSSMMIIRHV